MPRKQCEPEWRVDDITHVRGHVITVYSAGRRPALGSEVPRVAVTGMAVKLPPTATAILATPIDNVEESRAQRLQRQQSRFRDRGG